RPGHARLEGGRPAGDGEDHPAGIAPPGPRGAEGELRLPCSSCATAVFAWLAQTPHPGPLPGGAREPDSPAPRRGEGRGEGRSAGAPATRPSPWPSPRGEGTGIGPPLPWERAGVRVGPPGRRPPDPLPGPPPGGRGPEFLPLPEGARAGVRGSKAQVTRS